MDHAAVNRLDRGYQRLEGGKLDEFLERSADYATLLGEVERARHLLSQPTTMDLDEQNPPSPPSPAPDSRSSSPPRTCSPESDRSSSSQSSQSQYSASSSGSSDSNASRSSQISNRSAACRAAADSVQHWDETDHSDEPLSSGSNLTVAIALLQPEQRHLMLCCPAEAGLSGLKKRVEARAAVKEEAPERKEASVDVVSDEDAMGDSDEEFLGEMGAQPPFSEPGPVGSVPQPPRLRANLPLPIIGEEDTDEPTGQDSRPASPSASPTISEPFSLLSPIDANVPTLSSNFVAVVAPQPRRPTTLVRDIFQRPPPSLLLSSSDSDTLPSLHSISSGRSGVSAGTFNFRRQQDRTGSYFPAAPTVANGRGSPFQSYRFSHRSPSGYAEVDKAEFECHLATIRTLPAASFLDLNERTMDIVRTQLMAQDHDEFLGRQRDEENRKMLLILSRVHEVMSRAGPFLDQAAMRRGEKVNIDLHTYEVDRA
ncbi:hypothetical protein C8R47DRAFT_1084987, partial [Mycena vitilis]